MRPFSAACTVVVLAATVAAATDARAEGSPRDRVVPIARGKVPIPGGKVSTATKVSTAGGVVPIARGKMPVARGVVPAARGLVPVAHGQVSTAGGVVPIARGKMPIPGGKVSTATKVSTTGGVVPIARGKMPVARGVVPAARGLVPVAHGQAPVSQGVMRVARGPSSAALRTPPRDVAQALRSLELARMNLRRYERVDYPLRKRELDDAIRLLRAEIASTKRRLKEYERFKTKAFFTTLENLRLTLLDQELRLKRLRRERVLLQTHARDELRVRQLLINAARNEAERLIRQ